MVLRRRPLGVSNLGSRVAHQTSSNEFSENNTDDGRHDDPDTVIQLHSEAMVAVVCCGSPLLISLVNADG